MWVTRKTLVSWQIRGSKNKWNVRMWLWESEWSYCRHSYKSHFQYIWLLGSSRQLDDAGANFLTIMVRVTSHTWAFVKWFLLFRAFIFRWMKLPSWILKIFYVFLRFCVQFLVSLNNIIREREPNIIRYYFRQSRDLTHLYGKT